MGVHADGPTYTIRLAGYALDIARELALGGLGSAIFIWVGRLQRNLCAGGKTLNVPPVCDAVRHVSVTDLLEIKDNEDKRPELNVSFDHYFVKWKANLLFPGTRFERVVNEVRSRVQHLESLRPRSSGTQARRLVIIALAVFTSPLPCIGVEFELGDYFDAETEQKSKVARNKFVGRIGVNRFMDDYLVVASTRSKTLMKKIEIVHST